MMPASPSRACCQKEGSAPRRSIDHGYLGELAELCDGGGEHAQSGLVTVMRNPLRGQHRLEEVGGAGAKDGVVLFEDRPRVQSERGKLGLRERLLRFRAELASSFRPSELCLKSVKRIVERPCPLLRAFPSGHSRVGSPRPIRNSSSARSSGLATKNHSMREEVVVP